MVARRPEVKVDPSRGGRLLQSPPPVSVSPRTRPILAALDGCEPPSGSPVDSRVSLLLVGLVGGVGESRLAVVQRAPVDCSVRVVSFDVKKCRSRRRARREGLGASREARIAERNPGMRRGHRGADAIGGRGGNAAADARRPDRFEKHARETRESDCSVGALTVHAPVEHDVGLGPVDGVVHPAAGLLHAETAPLSLIDSGGSDRQRSGSGGPVERTRRGRVRRREGFEKPALASKRCSCAAVRAIVESRARTPRRKTTVVAGLDPIWGSGDVPQREGDP